MLAKQMAWAAKPAPHKTCDSLRAKDTTGSFVLALRRYLLRLYKHEKAQAVQADQAKEGKVADS